jgi:hypothetical protein
VPADSQKVVEKTSQITRYFGFMVAFFSRYEGISASEYPFYRKRSFRGSRKPLAPRTFGV